MTEKLTKVKVCINNINMLPLNNDKLLQNIRGTGSIAQLSCANISEDTNLSVNRVR